MRDHSRRCGIWTRNIHVQIQLSKLWARCFLFPRRSRPWQCWMKKKLFGHWLFIIFRNRLCGMLQCTNIDKIDLPIIGSDKSSYLHSFGSILCKLVWILCDTLFESENYHTVVFFWRPVLSLLLTAFFSWMSSWVIYYWDYSLCNF